MYKALEAVSKRLPELIDQAVAIVDPIRAVARKEARSYLNRRGGYDSGNHSRVQLDGWYPSTGSANADIMPDLEEVRAQSRHLTRNNPLISGTMETKLTSIVGAGLRLQPQIDYQFLGISQKEATDLAKQIERHWRLWGHTPQDCDAEGWGTFEDLQELVLRQRSENGDVFVLLTYNDNPISGYHLQLQIIEADRVSNPSRKAEEEDLAGGIEKKNGKPVAIWVNTSHPGSIRKTADEWQRVPIYDEKGNRQVLHLFEKRRPGQSRGVPDLAPLIITLKQLCDYTEAEIDAALVGAMHNLAIKSTNPAAITSANGIPGQAKEKREPTTTAEMDKRVKTNARNVLVLGTNEDLMSIASNRSNASYDAFVTAICRQLAVGLRIPYELLIKHFTASYSASRAALLEAWRYFMEERAWLSRHFCQPVYEALVRELVLSGIIAMPGYVAGPPLVKAAYHRATWTGDAPGQLDEVKEVNAAILRLKAGLSTMERETLQMTGEDWEANLEQRREELDRIAELNLEGKFDLETLVQVPEQQQQQ